MSNVDTTKENDSERPFRLFNVITFCVKEHVTHLVPMNTPNHLSGFSQTIYNHLVLMYNGD